MRTAEEVTFGEPTGGFRLHEDVGPLEGWRLSLPDEPGLVSAPQRPHGALYGEPRYAFTPLVIRYGRKEWDEARAKAIVALPQLIAAVEAILEFADNRTPIHPGSFVIDDARAALKAAGVRQ